MSLPSAAAPAGAPPRTAALLRLHATLASHYPVRDWHWLPGVAPGPMDVIAGAVLVQHTTWANAERALGALRRAGAIDPQALTTLSQERLASLVRVAGTPVVKARRLQAIARTVQAAGGIAALLALPLPELRAALLGTHGIGDESADAIALYAAGQPAFVVDAYTRRLFGRLGCGPAPSAPYAAWQRWFERALPPDVALYRSFHAAVVLHGKAVCRATPRCAGCPLRPHCREGRRR